MNGTTMTRQQAETWGPWFQALGDANRLLILHLLASERRPMSVGEIVERADVGQSTVSYHLAKLARSRFVVADQIGTSSRWEINHRCLDHFPTAAEVMLGLRPSPDLARPDAAPARTAEPSRNSEVAVRPMEDDDWDAVAAIYRAGIATGNATFETEVPLWDDWDRAHRADLRFVAVLDRADGAYGADRAGGIDAADGTDGQPIGWVAAAPVSDRCAYAGVVEHSVYVDAAHGGRGVGRLLLEALISAAERAGIWTVQSGIFPENTASLALHQRCGFQVVGTRRRIGQLHGRWRDVVWVERRSESVR